MAGFQFPDEIEEKAEEKTEVKLGAPEDELEIEVVDDTPEKDKGRTALTEPVEDPTDDELNTYSEGVQNRIKKLTHARHDERRAKEAIEREKLELERMASSLLEENKKLKKYVNQGEQYFAESSQKTAELELDAARKALVAAHSDGDVAAIVAAQELMADAKLKMSEAKKFKPTPLQEDTFEVQTPKVKTQSAQLDQRTLRWQAKNQWFGSDGFEEVTSYALGLHQKLVKEGAEAGSDSYFETVDARVKSKFPEFFGETKKETKAVDSKRPTSVVAPASRTTGVKKVQLTSSAMALAKKFGLTPQQYAEQVAKLEN
jgi:hypothetical protein